MSYYGCENSHIGLLPRGGIHRDVRFGYLHRPPKQVGCRTCLKARIHTTPSSRTVVRACRIVVVNIHIQAFYHVGGYIVKSDFEISTDHLSGLAVARVSKPGIYHPSLQDRGQGMSGSGCEYSHTGLVPRGGIHREVRFRNLHRPPKQVGCGTCLKARVHTTPACRTRSGHVQLWS